MVQLSAKPAGPRLRADATRNRARILEAAEEAFIEHGADVPLDDIARRAGVGNATLYRHFPDRRALVRGVVIAVMDRATAVAERVLAESTDDPFEALSRLVHDSVDWKIGALGPLLSEWTDLRDPEIYAAKERLDRAVQAIVDAAQAAGTLRPDVAAVDIMMAASQLVRPFPGAGCKPGIDRSPGLRAFASEKG